ncbi:hypothetical protein [Streptomyces oceani]|uniref:Uncharacterized protein n=1 Tax=Streptomyces oceani TaxID=1075402 RepID=A0A1E7KM42_9ACTN|nr:hypothetical protein [Streptomyces oceani]OEV04968.1 hypothetical protein AN216_05010 [Streptomyces oceani]
MLDIGYSLSPRFPDPPQTDYRSADVRALRHDLFCGDVYLADTRADRELSTRWGWVPVLDFAWALCDTVERIGGTAAYAELDFTESTDCLVFERRAGAAGDFLVEITADWQYTDEPPLTFRQGMLRRESRDFLHDLLADLVDMHEGLGDNPSVLGLYGRFPRI